MQHAPNASHSFLPVKPSNHEHRLQAATDGRQPATIASQPSCPTHCQSLRCTVQPAALRMRSSEQLSANYSWRSRADQPMRAATSLDSARWYCRQSPCLIARPVVILAWAVARLVVVLWALAGVVGVIVVVLVVMVVAGLVVVSVVVCVVVVLWSKPQLQQEGDRQLAVVKRCSQVQCSRWSVS